jgi:two-component system, NarL family, nitrate/nitrite response regulator NarL
MTRVVVVADIFVYREGLAEALAREEGVEVVGSGSSEPADLERMRAANPDVVLLDAAVPESLETGRKVRAVIPDAELLAVAVSEVEDDVVAWAEVGISGFVSRGASLHEVADAVEGAIHGELDCSPRVAATLLRHVGMLARVHHIDRPNVCLTPREREVIKLIDAGLSNQEIARRLFIELPTVKSHVHNILEKLRVHRRADAAARMRGA